MKTIILAAGLLLASLPAFAQSKADLAHQACVRAYDAGKIKTMVGFTRCANKALEPQLRSHGVLMDIVDYYLAQRLAIAENVDRGNMTQIEGAAQMASLQTSLVGEIQRRTQKPAVVIQQPQQKAVTFCNTLGISTVCF